MTTIETLYADWLIARTAWMAALDRVNAELKAAKAQGDGGGATEAQLLEEWAEPHQLEADRLRDEITATRAETEEEFAMKVRAFLTDCHDEPYGDGVSLSQDAQRFTDRAAMLKTIPPSRDPVYATDHQYTNLEKAEGIVSQLWGMARMGVAASETQSNIDLQRNGYISFFETMAKLAQEAHDHVCNAEDDARNIQGKLRRAAQ